MFAIVKSVFINLFDILPKMYRTVVVKPSIRPDIRYPALTGYPAFELAGYPAFELAGYPAKTVSGASLVFVGAV
jgi:hypothetical protein